MKKYFLYVAAFMLSLGGMMSACSDDDDLTKGNGNGAVEEINITKDNAANWYSYMINVANLLKEDATTLYDDWNTGYKGGASYASIFKSHNNSAYFGTANNCVRQIIEGCWDIANEVGDAKIGDPYDLYASGKTQDALYAVESWFSWHSREDYSNNIISIYSAICGTRNVKVSNDVMDLASSEIAANSIYNVVKANNNEGLADATREAIKKAYDAILAIPAPFRSHINSAEALAAQDACADLAILLNNKLLPEITQKQDIYNDAALNEVVNTYVDDVVLPTYKDLKDEVAVLLEKVSALQKNPTNANFKAAAAQWIIARKPWETSEAFLFGPVADNGLDPNMDSWPLDADAIVNILNSGDFTKLQWNGEFITDENGDPVESIASAQNVRGFHTLEFLLFKDGNPRTAPAE